MKFHYSDYQTENKTTSKIQLWFSLFWVAGVVFAGLFIGQFLGLGVSVFLTDFDLGKLYEIIDGYHEGSTARLVLLTTQAFIAFSMFLAFPFLYLKYSEKTFPKLEDIPFRKKQPLLLILTTILVIISYFPLGSLIVHWNENWIFPDFLSNFEQWAITKEQELKKLTLFVTDFQSNTEYIFGLLVIAVLPALGEEFLFRGILQPKFERIFGNIHLAIWLTAFLFSVMHFQFYGLIPRMLLGVMFGYLFYWSKNLVFPIVAHFVNNAYTLTALYFFRDQLPTLTEKTPAPNWGWVGISLLLTMIFLGLFYRIASKSVNYPTSFLKFK